MKKCENKKIRGKHPYLLSQNHIDKEASNKWLEQGAIYGENLSFMVGIQIINTKNYLKYIVKNSTVTRRKCNSQQETIEHITSGCSVLAPKIYRPTNSILK
jgi:hypothetical protein